MDIKDSYLHGSIGVVKSIDVNADKLIYTLADIANTTKEVTLPLATTSANGLAPKVINTNTATIGTAYYLLASSNGSATPSWYKLPANAFANDDTKVAQTNTTTSANYRVLFSETADDTTRTEGSRKSVNLQFNPYTGNLKTTSLNLNGDIVINDGTNHDRFIKFQYANGDNYGWRIGYLGDNTNSATNNYLTIDSYRNTDGWAPALQFKHDTMDATFGSSVTATSFIGNLDGTYVNKLTGYTKATAIGSIATTDSLNTALGKLEYRISTSESDLNSCLKWSANSYYNINPISQQENGNIRLSFRGTFGEEIKQVIGIGYSEGQVWFGNYLTSSFIRISDKITFQNKTLALLDDLVSDNIKIKNYTKATTIGAIANNDSLTTALGKLEFKTDFIYNDLFGTDNDDVINKWSEIVNFIDSVKETETDILDTFVTRKTEQEVTGRKTFSPYKGHSIRLRSYPLYTNYAKLVEENSKDPDYKIQDWVSLGMTCVVSKTENAVTTYEEHNGFLVYKGNTNYYVTNPDWSAIYKLLHSGNSNISGDVITINGSSITPITSGSLSTALSNYVTLDTPQIITGAKDFTNPIATYVTNSDGSKTGVRILGHGGGSHLQFGQFSAKSGETTKTHTGQITGINGAVLNSLNIQSNTTSFTGKIKTASDIEATGTIKATGGFIGNLTGNADTATIANCIPLIQITKESEIVDVSTIRGYFGSGDTFDTTAGRFESLKYSTLLSVGSPGRGFRLWITRWNTDVTNVIKSVPGFHYTVGDTETNPDWVDERVLLDTYNFNSFVPTLTGTGASGEWGISITGNAATASSLKSTIIIPTLTKSLSSASWVDTGYTFENLPTGTYAIQVTSGSTLVASGIMSVYKNLVDTVGDEIPLHVYGTATWRPYLRTHQNKLEISSNDIEARNRTVTIKIAQIL